MSLAYLTGERGLSEGVLLHLEVSFDEARNAIAFPYLDARGRVTSTRYRSLSGDGPRYLSERGARLGLYNVAGTDGEEVFVCEGEIDTLSILDHGKHAVGVPGANNFREAWRWLFVDRRVRIMFDGDKAGREGALRIARFCSGLAGDIEIVELPSGEDVNSLHVKGELGGLL